MTLRAVIWVAVSTKAQAKEEKYSLEKQETDAVALCKRNQWEIIDILRVPGHSRRYFDLSECANDMLQQGIDAFARLIEHWKSRDFDILIVRDGDRFARTQALHARVTEETIATGARIYSIEGGEFINERNYRMWTAMQGYASASHVDNLVQASKRGMNKRLELGLTVSSRTPLGYKRVRDHETGKELGIILDESLTRLRMDLAELLLEGIAMGKLGLELYRRFGHVDASGQPYSVSRFFFLLNSPAIWGHTALNFRPRDGRKRHLKGDWMFEEGHLIPDGVKINYHTHEPFYSGELGEKIKAELRRRSSTVIQTHQARSTHKFTGICICELCRCPMRYSTDPRYNWVGLYCGTQRDQRHTGISCQNVKSVSEKIVQEYLENFLEFYLSDEVVPDIFWQQIQGGGPTGTSATERILAVRAEIQQLEDEIRTLIISEARAPIASRHLYIEQIEKSSERLATLKSVADELSTEENITRLPPKMSHTRDLLRELTASAFWNQDVHFINTNIQSLLGPFRVGILNGNPTGFSKWKRKKRRNSPLL